MWEEIRGRLWAETEIHTKLLSGFLFFFSFFFYLLISRFVDFDYKIDDG